LKIDEVLKLGEGKVECTAAPIGIALPGAEGKLLAKVVDAGAPLPVRRRVALPVEKGVEKVALEIWEGKDEVKVEKAVRTPAEKVNGDDGEEDEDEEEEEEEDEEVKTPVTTKTLLLGVVEVALKNGGNVLLEVQVQRNGGVVVRAWEEGNEEGADRFEA